jgi:hypothetical protein
MPETVLIMPHEECVIDLMVEFEFPANVHSRLELRPGLSKELRVQLLSQNVGENILNFLTPVQGFYFN